MINVSDNDKAIWRSASAKKNVVITLPNINVEITNSDIVAESLELIERLESESNLSFMGCIASQFKVDLINFVQDIRDQYIEVTIIADGCDDAIPIFKGYVDTQSNATHEDIITSITAYDPLKKVLEKDVTTWYNSLSFPITIKNMRNSFFNLVGITQQVVTLENDALSVSKTITDSTITGDEIIRAICQLNGVFGQYGRDGKFKYHKLNQVMEGLYPAEDLYPADNLYPRESNANERVLKSSYTKASYQPFKTALISKVVIVNQNGGIQGQYGNNSGDTFYISDNKLAWGVNATQAARNLLSILNGIAYTPAVVNAKGFPYLECGDIITLNTNINVIETYILNRTLSGIQNLIDSYDSESDEHQKKYKISTETAISTNAQKASSAQNSANNAQTSANNAQTSANNAQNSANTAQNTANNAITRIGRIEADYVKTNQLQAVSARVGNLEADHVSVASLNAVNAKFNNLNANNITSGTLSVNRLNANSVTDTVLANCTGKSMTIYGLNVRQTFELGSTMVYWMSKTVKDSNGNNITIQYLGR